MGYGDGKVIGEVIEEVSDKRRLPYKKTRIQKIKNWILKKYFLSEVLEKMAVEYDRGYALAIRNKEFTYWSMGYRAAMQQYELKRLSLSELMTRYDDLKRSGLYEKVSE